MVGVVEAQQKPHDRRLAAARRTDQPQPLAGLGAEGKGFVAPCAACRDRRTARSRTRLVGARPCRACGAWRRRRPAGHRGCDRCPAPPTGRPCPGAAPTAARASAEDLDAQHQDDQQADSVMAPASTRAAPVDQRGRRAAGDRGIGDAARQRVAAQHPHGAAEKVARFDLELVGARLALAERLQRRQALDGIEELGGERGIGLLPPHRAPDVPLVPQRRRQQRHQGEGQHDQRHRQVDEGDDGEDQDRREERDQELRQELAEIGLELLDAVDHGERERARALPSTVPGPSDATLS